MAELDHNGLLANLQHGSLTFCYILVPPDCRVPTG